MAMTVKNNMQAKNTLNQLNRNQKALSKDLKKVASGMKINSAADDASGLSIAEKMDVRLRSLEQDNQNVQNGNSMMKVAEGAMSSTVDILKTLKEKVINAANDTNSATDRAIIQKEIDQSIDQIDDNANVTYNGKLLLDGSHNSLVLPSKTGEAGVQSCYTNESFAEGTSKTTKLTNLKDRNGQLLGIHSTDTITMSYVKNGKTYIHSETVGTMNFMKVFQWDPAKQDMGLQGTDENGSKAYIGINQYGDKVYTPDNGDALTFVATKGGIDGQISGMCFSITDENGNVRKSVNAIFDKFELSISAQNNSDDNAIVLQSGTKANDAIKVGFSDMRAEALGLKCSDGNPLDIAGGSSMVDPSSARANSQQRANVAINVLDAALQKVLNQQTNIGAVQSRLDYTSSNIIVAAENTQSSMSVIRDADMAKEMTSYTKNNVLMQASQSMLAQANQNSSSVLSLLQ